LIVGEIVISNEFRLEPVVDRTSPEGTGAGTMRG
jgi:hypothetical protein